MDLCICHSQPSTWCPDRRPVSRSDSPTVTYLGEPEPGVVFQTYHPSECGICGGPIVIGDTVVRLPAPTWSRDMAHALCPP